METVAKVNSLDNLASKIVRLLTFATVSLELSKEVDLVNRRSTSVRMTEVVLTEVPYLA